MELLRVVDWDHRQHYRVDFWAYNFRVDSSCVEHDNRVELENGDKRDQDWSSEQQKVLWALILILFKQDWIFYKFFMFIFMRF